MKIEVLLLIFCLHFCCFNAFDFGSKSPYDILKISRQSTFPEIRRAYKKLAKENHPDKSSDPDAENKFVEIKKAYELLSSADRRRVFDFYGITNEDSNLYQRPAQEFRNTQNLFNDFFSHSGFQEEDISIYHKLSITTKYFEQHVIPKSFVTPQVILFFSDWCFRCIRAVGAFSKLTEVLDKIGIQFATINAGHEQLLLRKIGINDVPSLVVVLNGHSYIYKDNVITVQNVVDFLRRKLPYKMLRNINDNNVNNFLDGWIDNRVRIILLQQKNPPRLRYLVISYMFRHRVAFGFVQLNHKDTQEIQSRFKVHPALDTMLIFNENSKQPVASVSMTDIPTATLKNIISSNQYLALPRLSSQQILEDICPAEWNRPRKKLCVILITKNNDAHNYARQSLRKIALKSSYSSERVRFAYIFQEKQQDFLSSLNRGSVNDILLHIVIIWRRDNTHIKYEWLKGTRLNNDRLDSIFEEGNLNETKTLLDTTIKRLLRSSESLTYEAFVKDLLDEHRQGLIASIISKIFNFLDYVNDNIGQEHIWAGLSVLGTIAFMLSIGYLMVYLVRIEEENLKKNGKLSYKTKKQTAFVPELKLHELRAEKYNGLVRLLKPGCRTILLITDVASRKKLIPGFHKAVWPYRKNKTLMFSHMLIEKGLSWYSEVLRLSLSESRDLIINPRNCIGTVIALNGHRKYFCMFHAKHPETNRDNKRMAKMAKHLGKKYEDPEAGAFLNNAGNEDFEHGYNQQILLEENLLDGLSIWLDKLFEGMTDRYYVNYWPDFPTK